MSGTMNSRVGMLSSINTALQNVAAKPVNSKPYRISDIIPRSWEGNNEKSELRSFMSDLHFWMQAWSNQGEMIFTSVERVDKFDSSAIAADCPDAEFRLTEASLYQVLHRTTVSEPLRRAQQTKGQKGFEAWHALVRRYEQRNMADKNSANAALISNISQQDRAKDVEQYDDVLRTVINDTNKFKNRFGTIRDEEKMLAVQKLMRESLLSYRFRGTTMSYSELLIALENIISDKVATVPTVGSRRADTSAPMEIGMAAKDDGGKCEGRRGSKNRGLRTTGFLFTKGWTGKGKWSFGKGQNWNRKGVPWWQRWQRWRKEPMAKGRRQGMAAKGKRKVAREKAEPVGTCGKARHIAAWCRKGGNKNLYATDEEDSEHVEEANDSEEDLQAWCLLEESEYEQ